MKKVRIDSWNRRQYSSTSSQQRVGHIGATGHLPPSQLAQQHGEGSVIQQSQQANLLLYRRGAQRQRDDLNISISAAPNAGLHPFQPSIPRITSTRHPRTTSDSRQMATPTPPAASTGKPFSDGAKYLNPLPSRPPTSKVASSTHEPLPPIAGASTEPLDCLTDSTTQCDSDTEGDSQDSEESLSDTEYGEEVIEDDDDDDPSALSEEQLHHKERRLLLSEVEIPPLLGPEQPFPATIIQEHALLDTERYAAGVRPSGLSERVDNIVRGFQVRGLLNKDTLSRALDAVARLHPMLTVQFYRKNNKVYIQCNPEEASVQLESPTFSGEKPQDAIILARHKLFQLPIQEIATSSEGEVEHEAATKGLSTLGVCDTQATAAFERETAVAPNTAVQGDWQQRGEDTLMRLPQISRPGWRDSEKYSQATLGIEQKSTLSMGSRFTTLLHAKLLSKSPQEHYLILSFPRIVADYWSSALFAQQLTDAYTQLEKLNAPGLTHYRPGDSKKAGPGQKIRIGPPGTSIHSSMNRGVVGGVYGRLGNTLGRGAVAGVGGASRFPRLSSARTKSGKKAASMINVRFPPQMHFKQIADRETQHLQIVPKEGLWAFWESMVTAIIKRQRGPPRIKVVPPARLQSKLGDLKHLKKSRPKTSRLRPATARFIASKDQESSAAHDNLAGPTSAFHFIHVEDVVCEALKASSPGSTISNIPEQQLMKIFCLSAFTVMLGRCCRGWGKDEVVANQLRGQADGCSGCFLPQEGSSTKVPTVTQLVRGRTQQPVQGQCRPKTAHRSMTGGRLDLGSFLIGVEITARDLDPERMAGVFGPLTNDVGIRVNLSSCETFADLMVAVERQLRISSRHAHFPFKTIIEEIGILNGIPIKFSYLHDYDIAQLTDPNAFYFTETAVGVEGQALARMGSCYLQPLNGKLNDNCYFELIMWESSDGCSLAGGFRYHTSVIRQELVKQFGEELLRVMAIVADNVEYDLRTLASLIRSPFHKRKV